MYLQKLAKNLLGNTNNSSSNARNFHKNTYTTHTVSFSSTLIEATHVLNQKLEPSSPNTKSIMSTNTSQEEQYEIWHVWNDINVALIEEEYCKIMSSLDKYIIRKFHLHINQMPHCIPS